VAKGISIDLIVDPKKAIEGLGQVEGKASSVASTLGGLGVGAAAGVAALGTAAIGAVAGLTSASKSAGEYAENVELAASKTHLSTEAVQELQYASKITGVEFETITGSMTKLTKSMGAAQAGTGAQAEAFEQLGVATVDANGDLRDSTAVYSDVITALGEVSNPAERDVLAMQLLGKSARELNPLIDGSAGSLTDLAAQAHEAGAVMSGDMLTGLGGVDDAFDSLQAGADAAKNALGLALMPALTELGTEGSGLLGQFTNAILDAEGDVGKAAPAIGSVFGKAVTFLLGQAPKFLEVGSSIITSIITGIAQQAPTLIQQAVPVLVGFVTTLLGQLPMLLNAGLKVIIALVQGVAAALPVLIPAAVDALLGLVGALLDNLPLLIDAGIQLILGLGLGLIDAIPQLVEAIPDIITSLITGLVGAIPQLVMAGVKLIVAIVENLPAIIEGIISAVPAIINALVDTLGDPKFWKQLGEAGLMLIEGLWEGIKGAGTWLWEQLSSFFGDVIDNIKGLFGIHSPSTVFAGLGKNMIQGLEKGLTGPNDLGAISGDLADQVQNGFQGSLGVTARSIVQTGGGASGGSTVVVQAPAPSLVGLQLTLMVDGRPMAAYIAEGAHAVVAGSNSSQQEILGAGRQMR
jgi:phage-related protein